MREFKFRAWDKQENLLYDWKYLINCIQYGGNKINGTDIDDCIFNDTDLILMQFTGLKDKNGKDIYDGDIVKQLPGFGCEWEDRIGVVKYSGASFWFDLGGQAFILDDHDCDFEVIGNIYENPELMKG